MNTPLQILPNSFIKVINGEIEGKPFTLPTNYQAGDETITNRISDCPLAIKLSLGLYPVIEVLPTFDSGYQVCTPVYAVHTDYVELAYTVTDQPIDILKQTGIAKAYEVCVSTLNAESAGYSMAEIATFPAMQSEIKQYNFDGVIGSLMQEVINRGRHTASTLSALLTPKISTQEQALLVRDMRWLRL